MNQLLPLADDIVKTIEDQIDSGRFDSAKNVLRAAWLAGLKSGDFAPLDLDSIKAAGRTRLSQQ